jgi:hypothetical protein
MGVDGIEMRLWRLIAHDGSCSTLALRGEGQGQAGARPLIFRRRSPPHFPTTSCQKPQTLDFLETQQRLDRQSFEPQGTEFSESITEQRQISSWIGDTLYGSNMTGHRSRRKSYTLKHYTNQDSSKQIQPHFFQRRNALALQIWACSTRSSHATVSSGNLMPTGRDST